MNVVLIGYRACGKSTVGKLLAEKLKIAFLDTDLLIEENLGMPIKEIVASQGWDYFRAREKEAVQELAQRSECVIATGGGVVL
ncbi:MAG: shikimate kinase, partial [Syntrophaceae bacterium]|nr:shikimate kinase [Syntrophaceae bacterium]